MKYTRSTGKGISRPCSNTFRPPRASRWAGRGTSVTAAWCVSMGIAFLRTASFTERATATGRPPPAPAGKARSEDTRAGRGRSPTAPRPPGSRPARTPDGKVRRADGGDGIVDGGGDPVPLEAGQHGVTVGHADHVQVPHV